MIQDAPQVESGDDLSALLERLDLRLRLAVDGLRTELAERARDPFRGLYISDTDVDELLASAPPAEVAEQLLDDQLKPRPPRLRHLAALFDLDPFEQEALLVCLAPDLDIRYERLYAYLQDDVNRRRPSVDLVLRLIAPPSQANVDARASLGPGGRLMRRGLLTAPPEETSQASLLARPLRPEERIVEYVLGSNRLDSRLAAYTQLYPADDSARNWALPPEVQLGLVRVFSQHNTGRLVYLQGPAGAAKRAIARAACAGAERPLLLVDLPAVLAGHGDRASLILSSAVREALLQDAVLGLDGFEVLLGDDPSAGLALAALKRAFAEHREPVVLLGEGRWEPAAWLPGMPAVRIDLAGLGASDRVRLWRSQVNGQVPPDAVSELAARYRLV
jgi:hypothetical protein